MSSSTATRPLQTYTSTALSAVTMKNNIQDIYFAEKRNLVKRNEIR